MYAILALALLSAASAAPLDESWLQPRDSPIAALFSKRYTPSPSDSNFTSNYPAAGSTPPTSSIPAAWLSKLSTISMPNISVTSPNNGYPTYADGESGADSHICSFTYACTTEDDLLTPPDGVLALSFDDGPTSASPTLYDFLAKNNIASAATHFMIGGNILYDPAEMQVAVNAGGHIAVHTWSHQYMTTLTNEQVVAELGWTMQIISDLNGGRIPKFWRPPYGDVDNRVRAIAKGVFGLETVVWNQDSADWAIGSNSQYTLSSVEAMMDGWLTASNKTGLCILEHELNDNTVGVFMTEYPKMQSNGWDVKNIADAWGMDWYVNSGKGNTDSVTTMSVGAGTLAVVNSTTSASSSTSSSAVSTTSSGTSSGSASTTSSRSQASSTSASATAVAAASTTSTSSASSTLADLPHMSGFLFATAGLIGFFFY